MALTPRAFVAHQNQLYFSAATDHPVGALIEGIWTLDPAQARAITRNRIFTGQALSPLCDGMLRVAGKRASVLDHSEFERQWMDAQNGKNKIEVRPQDLSTPCPVEIDDRSYSQNEALVVAQQIAEHSKLKIGAALLDEAGRIVSWGWNEHFPNKIIHAEVMLVKNYHSQFKKKIPPGHTLVSTLQPCAMCAGYLHGHCENFSSLKITYEEEDPGPNAQNSILVAGSSLWMKHCSS